MTTGYNIREGSDELARRRLQNQIDDDTNMIAVSLARMNRAGLITRRARVAVLARRALLLAFGPAAAVPDRKPW